MINSPQLLDAMMYMEIVDKIKNEDDDYDYVYLIKWSESTLSYSTLESIKQNLQPKDIIIYRNGDPLNDSQKDHFIGLVFENESKVEPDHSPSNSDSKTKKRFVIWVRIIM